MHKHIFGGITIWGILVTCFGLGTMNPTRAAANSFTYAGPDQELIFLLAGGIVTLLIGCIGLIGFMGRMPACAQQSEAEANCFQH